MKRFNDYEDLIKHIGADSPECIADFKNVLNYGDGDIVIYAIDDISEKIKIKKRVIEWLFICIEWPKF